MADHGHVEYATAEGNDLPEHEAAYDRFVHLALVGSAFVVNVVLGLAIGAVAGHWLVAFAIMIIAVGVAVHGFASGARVPSMVMVVISLLALALSSGGGSAH
jgi:Bacterial aa3 type cytochrome c oxidase subunit IV